MRAGTEKQGGPGDAFGALAEPYRREIQLHCYRMLGSVHEAEDVTQDTFIRAWRNHAGFDGRGSFRAWLYRIATNACLDALASRQRARRLLPNQRTAGLGAVPEQAPVGAPATDIAWLEPYSDRLLEGIADEAPNPEARYAQREAVRLAFVAVIQQLPPRQRAVLLLADVLGWPVAEIANTLGRTTASVNSGLQRARETLAKHFRHEAPATTAPDAAQARLVRRYIEAWEALDLDGFVALLKEDASLVMPPFPQWYRGRRAIADFHRIVWKDYRGFRLVATGANGQPAAALYARTEAGGAWQAHSLHVLTLQDADIGALTLFVPPEGPRLFAAFGLPPIL